MEKGSCDSEGIESSRFFGRSQRILREEQGFRIVFRLWSQLQNQDIADAAFAAISGNKHAQSTIDMQELIIYQQSQHIAMLQQQLTQLRQKLESMEQTEKAVERAAMPKERSASV